MKAVVITGFHTTPELADVPSPVPAAGEALVRLHAAGMNPFDWKVIDGALENVVPHRFPLVLGSDGAGVVEAVGAEVTGVEVGDRVCGQFMRVAEGHGSYAERAVAPEGKLARIPDSLPFALAAALPTASVTGLQVIEALDPQPGQRVLVNGASGGVGQIALQFAARAGARVLATGPADLSGHLRDLGAHEIVDFAVAPTHEQVAAAHPDGIDLVVDLVTPSGGDAGPLAGLLRPGGTILNTNYALDVEALEARGLRGINFGNHPTPEVLARIAELVATGALTVRVDAEIPLAEAPDAIARAREGHASGKTVLIV